MFYFTDGFLSDIISISQALPATVFRGLGGLDYDTESPPLAFPTPPPFVIPGGCIFLMTILVFFKDDTFYCFRTFLYLCHKFRLSF